MPSPSDTADYATRYPFDTRVGAYCVVIEGNSILLVHLHPDAFGTDEWTLPGGGLEPHETPEQAALREVFEETGLHVELTGLLAVDSFTIPAADRLIEADRHRPLLSLRIMYAAKRTGGELRPEQNGSTDAASWIELGSVASLNRVELVDVGLRAAGGNNVG